MRPDFLTIQLGEQNATIVNLITDCFDKVKDHDFTGASACAAQILANSSALDQPQEQLHDDPAADPDHGLAAAAARHRGRQLPEPVPAGARRHRRDRRSCASRSSTRSRPARSAGRSCRRRCSTLDQVFQKLNQTLKDAHGAVPAGAERARRWVYVDVYPKFKDHCMTMKVQIKTKVEHPEESGAVHEHDSPEVNFGCSTTWFVEGSDGTAKPNYLDSGRARRPHRVEPDDQGHGRLRQRGRAQVHRRRDLGGRHDRPRDDAAEVEAGVRGGVELRHLLVSAS